jgi:hypothetical protein
MGMSRCSRPWQIGVIGMQKELFSRNGKLFRSKLTSKGLREPKELADFNANQFAELAPPQWASRW